MSYLAVDLGTSFIKGAILDLDRLCIEHLRRRPFPHPVPGLPPLCHEVDPDAVVHATASLLDELAGHAPDCQGVVVCGQMHGLVLTDNHLAPLSNAITWLDQRALMPHPAQPGTVFDELRSRIDDVQHHQLGNELKPSLPLCALFWLAERGDLPGGPAVPASLPDFVLARLSGSPPRVEATMAASQGALNLETGAWHGGVLDKLGLAHLRWPDLAPAQQSVYTLRLAGRAVGCCAALGDHQAALLGALLQPDELSLNISTGSQVSLLADTLRYGDYQVRPFFDGRFLKTISRIPAGRSLSALVSLLQELAAGPGVDLPDPWPAIAAKAAAVEQTDLRVNLAFFASTAGDRGEIANIREDNLSVGHLFRAAFEHMADNYLTCARRLDPAQPWRRLVFSGGLAQRISLLREIVAGRLGAPLRLCPTEEDTLLGLLALALVVDGRADSLANATTTLMAEAQAGHRFC